MCLLRTLYHYYYYYFITIIIIIILYLKWFNKSIPYQHLKMDTLKTVLNLIAKDCSLASLDLKVAYYSISNYRKYLWFLWRGQHNQFTCSPYGLSSCPTKFTDLIKPSITARHRLAHISSNYFNDLILQNVHWLCMQCNSYCFSIRPTGVCFSSW